MEERIKISDVEWLQTELEKIERRLSALETATSLTKLSSICVLPTRKGAMEMEKLSDKNVLAVARSCKDYEEAPYIADIAKELVDARAQLAALQDKVRWVPVSERYPTIADCPSKDDPWVVARIHGRLYGLVRIDQFEGYPYDEWRSLDLPSSPIPAEGEND